MAFLLGEKICPDSGEDGKPGFFLMYCAKLRIYKTGNNRIHESVQEKTIQH